MRRLGTDTKVLHLKLADQLATLAPSSFPIFQTATFAQESHNQLDRYHYTRSKNPTRSALEVSLAALESNDDSKQVYSYALNSGMAAISACFQLLSPGQPIVAGNDLYGGTSRLLDLNSRTNSVDFVDLQDLDQVRVQLRKAAQPGLLWIESPSNPLMKLCDLKALRKISSEYGWIMGIDNTMLSSYLQKPLDLGIDLAVQSATKFLGGHGDVTAGVVSTCDPALAKKIRFIINCYGTALAPFESWLLLRGLKTLPVRMERQQKSTIEILDFLSNSLNVTRVHYAGTKHSPRGSMISFETGDVEISSTLLNSFNLFKKQVSFGSIVSSVEIPAFFSHASIPKNVKHTFQLPEDLIRMSIGLEDPRDLIEDLRQGLDQVTSPRSSSATVSPMRRSFSTQRCLETETVHAGERTNRETVADTLTTPIAQNSAYYFKDSAVSLFLIVFSS